MRIGAAVLGSSIATSAWAQEAETEEPKRFVHTLPGQILLGEGLFPINAGMATLLALFSPLVASETDSRPSVYWSGLAAAEGLAAYRIAELGKNGDTDAQQAIPPRDP